LKFVCFFFLARLENGQFASRRPTGFFLFIYLCPL
jgi:hypothetical protein